MKLSIRHNLNDAELTQAITGMAKAAGIEQHVADLLQKAACDCGPKQPRDPAMKELYARFRKEYQAAIKDILTAIEHIVTGRMEKAQKPTAPLTKQQISDIQQAIKDRFSWVAAQMQDDFTPPTDLIERWKIHGWVAPKTKVRDFALMVTPEKKLLHNAFVFGRLYRAMEQGKSYKEILKLALGMPLKEPDRHAIAIAEHQAANHITALGDDLAKDAAGIIARHNRQKIKQMVIDAHAQKLRAKVLDADKKRELGIATPEKTVTGWKELKSELYHAMDDKSRDWDRVAFYELNDSRQQGQALAIAEELGPKRMVYKMPLPTACPQCKHAYLDEDGNPRVFALDTMIANGDNIGRKPHPVRAGRVVPGGRKDQAETVRPVAGLMHPWCACLGPYPYTGHEPWAKQRKQGTTTVEPMAKSDLVQVSQAMADRFHRELKEALGQGEPQQKTICVDFDGVISDYSQGFQGADVFGPPIQGAAESIAALREQGWKVIIHTTRKETHGLRSYLRRNGIWFDEINRNNSQPKDTNQGKPMADVYLDDRAVRFTSWDQALADIGSLKKSGARIRLVAKDKARPGLYLIQKATRSKQKKAPRQMS